MEKWILLAFHFLNILSSCHTANPIMTNIHSQVIFGGALNGTGYHKETVKTEKTKPGCPEGFFGLNGIQCFKIFGDVYGTWEEARSKCASEDLLFAEPCPKIAVQLRKYLFDTYGGDYGVWLGARGNNFNMVWVHDNTPLNNTSPMWLPGNPFDVTNNACLLMVVLSRYLNDHPGRPYASWPCNEKKYRAYALCEGENSIRGNTDDPPVEKGNVRMFRPPKSQSCEQEECRWDMDCEFPNNKPLILKKKNNVEKEVIILPVLTEDTEAAGEYDRIISVDDDTELIIACPGKGNELRQFKEQNIKVTTKCSSGSKKLTYKNKDYIMKQLGCTEKVQSSVKIPEESIPCGFDENLNIKGVIYYIGFENSYSNDGIYRMITVCFDINKRTTLWTQHILHGKNLEARDRVERDSQLKNEAMDLTHTELKEMYNRQIQNENFGEAIVSRGGELYLVKGHMSPFADFVTRAEKLATDYYINVLPQWQIVNNGNWKHLEEDIRGLAKKREHGLIIISGGHGILNVERHTTGNMYLGVAIDENNFVPVPKHTWKVVFDKHTNSAIAFVVVNNPYALSPRRLCKEDEKPWDCQGVKWLHHLQESRDELKKGFTYCCTIKEFKKIDNTIERVLRRYEIKDNVEILLN